MSYRPSPRCPRYLIGEDGTIIGPSGKKLTPGTHLQGYKQVLIYPGGGASRSLVAVHILVCEAFHGPKPSPKHQVAHWDGNEANNAASNLRWATAAENVADRIRHGTVTRTSGEVDGMAKLTQSQVLEIRRRHKAGEAQRALAREFGVKQPTISNIITRKTWSHC